MSTTIKRVALIAVAALGLSLVSVAPSNAAINSDTLTLSAATATQTTAETYTATSAVATFSFLGAVGDSASVTAALVSGPATNIALPFLRLTETASATINDANATAVGTAINPNTAVRVGAISASAVTTAKFAVYLGTTGTTAPTVAGTYVVRVTPTTLGASGSLLGATAQTLTITVTTAATLDNVIVASLSTSILNTGETNTATADATGVTGSKDVPATNNAAVGTIVTTLKNAGGTTRTAESYTAQVLSGPGLLGSGAMAGAADNGSTATGRAITVKAGDVVGIFPDGASGVSTIEIRTAAGVLIGTETVTFYGAISRIVATLVKPVIAVAGSATTGVITAVAYDAAGTVVSAGNLFANSGTTTVAASVGSTAITGGKATFDLTGLVVGTTAITVANAATSATVSATAVTVRVGSSTPASITVAMDKASYTTGEAITATITVLDATGLAVADGVYNNIFASGGISANYTTSFSDTTTVTTVSGVGTRTGFLPAAEGDVVFKWTTGTNLATANQAVAGTATVSVSSASGNAAIDAANEATDAANAATDAALAAADAADAATAAAEDAAAAVATLAASVNTALASLKKQITALAALVNKLLKKK